MLRQTAVNRAFASSTLSRCGLVAAVAVLATACAQNGPGYYNPPPESTVTDAQSQYQDSRGRSLVRAPSQLQWQIDRQQAVTSTVAVANQPEPSGPPSKAGQASGTAEPAQTAASEAAPINPLAAQVIPEPRTFMGTVPCFTPRMECTAQRVTLTLSPNGRWRARATALGGASNAPVAEQGCWRGIPERPARVIVQDAGGAVRVELIQTAGNVLRVRSVGGQSPNLEYNLTRQPDLDGIDELSGQAPPACE